MLATVRRMRYGLQISNLDDARTASLPHKLQDGHFATKLPADGGVAFSKQGLGRGSLVFDDNGGEQQLTAVCGKTGIGRSSMARRQRVALLKLRQPSEVPANAKHGTW